jgi:Zn-dependent protease
MRLLGIVTGTFNFIMLLPFLPFAGGRVVRAVSESFWPRLSTLVTVFMTAAFASAAVKDQSIAFMILTAAGVQSLVYKPRAKQTRLSPNETLLVLATYSFCLTAHFTGGWWLLTGLL